MDNGHNSHNAYGGGYGGMNTQHSAAHNSHTVHDLKDPLDYLKEDRQKKDNNALGFWHRFLFHEEVQAAEAEIQYLNSTKSDKGGTSVGISDARLRFLAFKSHGIIRMSMLSLFLSACLFVGLFIFVSQLVAVTVSAMFLIHVFFPAYVIYGMQRFIEGERFTKAFYGKFLTIWRVFEIMYVCITVGVVYLSKFDWNILIEYIKNYQIKTMMFKKIIYFILNKFNAELVSLMLSIYGMVLLFGILIYLIVIYKRIKWAKKIQKDISFEHLKEVKRPAQLARIKSGKVRS